MGWHRRSLDNLVELTRTERWLVWFLNASSHVSAWHSTWRFEYVVDCGELLILVPTPILWPLVAACAMDWWYLSYFRPWSLDAAESRKIPTSNRQKPTASFLRQNSACTIKNRTDLLDTWFGFVQEVIVIICVLNRSYISGKEYLLVFEDLDGP